MLKINLKYHDYYYRYKKENSLEKKIPECAVLLYMQEF